MAIEESIYAEANIELALTEAAVFLTLALRFTHFTLRADRFFRGSRHTAHFTPASHSLKVPIVTANFRRPAVTSGHGNNEQDLMAVVHAPWHGGTLRLARDDGSHG